MPQEKQVKPKPPERSGKPEKVVKAERVEEVREAPRAERGENNVYIGRKPVMNYVVACITFFNAGEKQIVVKARGRAISRAVDTVELLRRAFVKDVNLKEINIGTEEVTREEGRKSNVSTIEITLAKAGSK